MAIGGGRRLFRKYRAYRSERDERADRFRDFLVKVVDESTTANERSDASSLIQHTLSIYRHKIIQQYCVLLTSIAIGGFGFLIFSSIDFNPIAWSFLFLGITLSAADLWFISTMRKDVEHSEWKIGEAWAGHLDKARSRKKSRSHS
ncbi:hypothetical protein EHW58_12980 [Salinivibrio sp. VYel1]|nr:hypothetical protein [Salinivibrio sp. VYel1]